MIKPKISVTGATGWAASHGIEDLVVEGGTLKEALA